MHIGVICCVFSSIFVIFDPKSSMILYELLTVKMIGINGERMSQLISYSIRKLTTTLIIDSIVCQRKVPNIH